MNKKTIDVKHYENTVHTAENLKAAVTLLLLTILAASFILFPMPIPIPIAAITFILWGIIYKKLENQENMWYSAIAQPVVEELFPGQGDTVFKKCLHANILKNLGVSASGCRVQSSKGYLTKEINDYLITMGEFLLVLPGRGSNYPRVAYMIQTPSKINGTFYISSDKSLIFNHRKSNYKTGDTSFDQKTCTVTSDPDFAAHYLTEPAKDKILQLIQKYHSVTLYMDQKRILAISRGSISVSVVSPKPSADVYRNQLLEYLHLCEELINLIPH